MACEAAPCATILRTLVCTGVGCWDSTQRFSCLPGPIAAGLRAPRRVIAGRSHHGASAVSMHVIKAAASDALDR
jgi:hypothetical protein